MLALLPVRDGVLPAGGDEAAAECGGRSLVVGTGTRVAAALLPGTATCWELGPYRPGAWAEALAAQLADEAVVVLPASPDGRDLAPRLAAVLDRPLFAGAVRVSHEQVVTARQGGLSMHTSPAPEAFVATLQPGVRGVEHAGHPALVDELQVAPPDGDPASGLPPDAELEAVLEPDAATIDLAEATRIVGGGAGLSGREQFDQLARLGAVLGASVGATRVITDRGWIDHERQIGTTGVVVDPRLYVAFGISGAVQHTSGLGHPDHIVSVNLDAHCPMMQLADLAVVADADAVLAALLEVLGA